MGDRGSQCTQNTAKLLHRRWWVAIGYVCIPYWFALQEWQEKGDRCSELWKGTLWYALSRDTLTKGSQVFVDDSR